ncbi:MAG TPA: hypothetical protein VIY48_08585 [Candidatus Paceibacterota bacterium]
MKLVIAVHSEAFQADMAGKADELRRALVLKVTKLSIDLQRSVKEDKLTGQVLHVRTGTLRRSINREVQQTRDGVFATIGTNLNYGIGWENGFTRKLGAGARGGPKNLLGLARERYFSKHPPGTRDEHRPFLRPTLEEFRPRIVNELRATVMEVLT